MGTTLDQLTIKPMQNGSPPQAWGQPFDDGTTLETGSGSPPQAWGQHIFRL